MRLAPSQEPLSSLQLLFAAILVLPGIAPASVSRGAPAASVPTVEFTTATQSDGEAASTLTATLQLSAAHTADVTIPFTITGNAEDGADFTVGVTSPALIAMGQTSTDIVITLIDDALDENDETIVLTLGTPTEATLGAIDVHTATVLDDDPEPVVELALATANAGEETGTTSVGVVLSTPSGRDVTVPFTVTGTATEVDDFTAPPSPLVIPAGSSSVDIDLTLVDDLLDEDPESIEITLGTPTGATLGTTLVFTATLQDDDPEPAVDLSLADEDVGEETGTAIVSVVLSTLSGRDVTIPFSVDGSATQVDDFTVTASPVVISAGEIAADIELTLVDDLIDEDSETVEITLGAPTNATPGTTLVYTATLIDDDLPPVVDLTMTGTNVGEETGSTSVGVALSGPSSFEVSVPFTVTGTALDGSDFTVTASPLLIPVGATSGNIDITLLDDGLDEDDETVEITLGAPGNATLGTVTAFTATLQDDDPEPVVDLSAASASVGEETAGAVVSVMLSAASGRDVIVPFSVGGTAVDGTDFSVTVSPVTITAGNTSTDITIVPVDDLLHELDETVQITLQAPTNATLGSTLGFTATLVNDDPAPAVSFQSMLQIRNEFTGVFPVTVQLSAVSGLDVTFPFTTSGTATPGLDYTIGASPLIVPAGSQSNQILVTVIDDTDMEGTELLTIDMGAPTGASPGAFTQHTVTLQDNDLSSTPIIKGLRAQPTELTLPATRILESAGPQTILLTNDNTSPVAFNGIVPFGNGADSFRIDIPNTLPVILLPGQSTTFDVWFEPVSSGLQQALLGVRQRPAGIPRAFVSVEGQAFGPTGAELFLNAGNDDYVDVSSQTWQADYGVTGESFVVEGFAGMQVAGTLDDLLYSVERVGQSFGYSFDLPNGDYEVVLHLNELNIVSSAGVHVFDVSLEGQVAVDDFDIRAVTTHWSALTLGPLRTTVSDGALDIDFLASSGLASIAALEVRSFPVINADATAFNFGTVDQGSFEDETASISNSGLHVAEITNVSFVLPGGAPSAVDFSVDIAGQAYAGGATTTSYSISELIAPGSAIDIDLTFAPTFHDEHELILRLEGNFDAVDISLAGVGGADASWGFLHPVINTSVPILIDYDGNLTENVQLLGSESHTHEPGHVLTLYEWMEGGLLFSNATDPVYAFNVGDTAISLTIHDDNAPAAMATLQDTISVYPADAVPGVLAYYYDAAAGDPVSLLDSVPASANFMERISLLQITSGSGSVGGSPYVSNVMVRLVAKFDAPSAATYTFMTSGGAGERVLVDDTLVTGPVALTAGLHDLELRFAVENLIDLPLDVSIHIDGQPAPGFAGSLIHDEGSVLPVIHDMPRLGAETGGNLISIMGFGFTPQDQVVVHWGAQDFTHATFQSWQPGLIEFFSPPGTGMIQVTVETPAGITPALSFTYSPDGPVPIDFTRLDSEAVPATGVTTGEWGPDGRFYVGMLSGEIKAITYDQDYTVTDVQTYAGVSALTNFDLLGIVFNPYDPPSPVKVYVAHGEHYLNGGSSFTGPSPYTGHVSILTGPNFDNPVPLITGLPVSNHDHGVNGMQFDDNGDLYIAVGGNTNAGVKWAQIGDLPESPLSGAILKAELSNPAFNGVVTYVETATGMPNDDQVFGEEVDVAPGSHVTVYSPGLRNPYDLVYTTWGYLYATDNGPNGGFGPASLGPMTNSLPDHPNAVDEVLLIERGNYYGHPNRGRGRYDARQNIYHDPYVSSIPEEFTQQTATVNSSMDGIIEYRANTFGGQLRGNLLLQQWNYRPRRMILTEDNRHVYAIFSDIFPHTIGLDVQTGPGGAILVLNYTQNKVEILAPNDAAAVGLTVQDIFPWRAPASGGTSFVIGGEGFGSLANTVVTIGGIQATLTEVTPRRIKGVVPANPTPTADLQDLVVQVGFNVGTLPAAFRFMHPTPGGQLGFWVAGANAPSSLGEVACGIIGGEIIMVGEGSQGSKTFAYDLFNDNWSDSLAQRPFGGNHHGCEVIGNKVYLIGGLGGGAGQVQIYDRVANSWSLGTPMPWSGGSVATALIGGKIYVAGGIVGSTTVGNAAAYDPVANSWTVLQSIPTPVNHAAAATDGAKFYVFGGRQGGNWPQPGFSTVQVFDPAAGPLGSWDSSSLGGSALSPMPGGRGGTGRAVWYQGEFYVFGGETSNSSEPDVQPGNVFGTVFAYNPVTNSWREDKPMPTPRHGIFPILFQNRIFVAAGGVVVGNSQSTGLEIFQRL